MGKGALLWEEAKKIIPGGNQLLSKRSEMFLPDHWPSYYKKAKGCEIWDLDDKHYYDFASMGVGSCVLGYADDDVDNAVIEAVNAGSMSSLNSWEEVELAQQLIALHPWSEMARFSRTGGEACSIAIRIARAAAGKDKIAFCGYHGWHDWYISANLGDEGNLDGQLLPGLKPKGVPRKLRETSIPFNYNRLDELEKIVRVNPNEIGVIIMEPVRGHDPEKGFLEGVREIANKIGAVLIFDEVTSGFKLNMGGIHLNYKVEPDMAVFGKALGNGFPISAILGKRKIMDVAQESFISSTFWTERLGFVAALATLKKMKSHNVQKSLAKYGETIKNGWLKVAENAGLNVVVSGISSLPHISFDYPDALAMQTYYTQEMLKLGFLVSASMATTYAYNPALLEKFNNATEDVFLKLSTILKKGGDITEHLLGPVKHAGFKRLT